MRALLIPARPYALGFLSDLASINYIICGKSGSVIHTWEEGERGNELKWHRR